MGLPSLRSNTLLSPLLHSYLKVEEGEESQKNITDNKISELMKECEICFEPKMIADMQTIPHEKYQKQSVDNTTKCLAQEKPLYCKDCVTQLRPPKCPRCRDKLVTENTSIAIQVQPNPIEENHQVIIPILDLVQEHDAPAEGQAENLQVVHQSTKCSQLVFRTLFFMGVIVLIGVVPSIIENNI